MKRTYLQKNTMKTKIIFFVIVLSIGVYSFADVKKGKCQFYGSEPSHVLTNADGMEVYYSDKFYLKGTSGNYHIYTGTGTIWIIFHQKKGAEKFKFEGNANIQQCHDYSSNY